MLFSDLLLAATALFVHVSGLPNEARAASGPTAKTKIGTYQGVALPEYDQEVFLGVPYAQPPVGDLRFRNPQSLNTSFSGKREAVDYSPECVGYSSDDWPYPLSEDCLYLNVIRPAGTKANAKLPIALWIYGGGFTAGGASDKRYNLSFIVDNSVAIGTPMIGVSINYRVSAWGFLASEDLAVEGITNMGLRDQRLALHWVQENIAAFGGDPSKVTIWGESAGAQSVGFHLVAYGGRDDGLFRGAMMESGNPIQAQTSYTPSYYDATYNEILTGVNCTSAIDRLACLRSVPYETFNAFINGTGLTHWPPTLDGDFQQRVGSVQLADGAFVHVPIIVGANTDEGTMFGPKGINTSAEWAAALEAGSIRPNIPLSPEVVQLIMDAYPDDPCAGIPATLNCTRPGALYGAEYLRTSAFAGDQTFIANRRLTCQTWSANGVDAYCYRFNGWPNGLTEYTGFTHFSEVSLVMDNTMGVGYVVAPDPFANRPQSLFDLATLMSCSWASFVATGNPNTWRETNTSISLWPAYDVANPQIIVWDNNVTTYLEVDDFRSEGIDLINSFNLAWFR